MAVSALELVARSTARFDRAPHRADWFRPGRRQSGRGSAQWPDVLHLPALWSHGRSGGRFPCRRHPRGSLRDAPAQASRCHFPALTRPFMGLFSAHDSGQQRTQPRLRSQNLPQIHRRPGGSGPVADRQFWLRGRQPQPLAAQEEAGPDPRRVLLSAGGRRPGRQERRRLEQARVVHLAGQPVRAGTAAGEVPRATAPAHQRPGPHARPRGEAPLHRCGHPRLHRQPRNQQARRAAALQLLEQLQREAAAHPGRLERADHPLPSRRRQPPGAARVLPHRAARAIHPLHRELGRAGARPARRPRHDADGPKPPAARGQPVQAASRHHRTLLRPGHPRRARRPVQQPLRRDQAIPRTWSGWPSPSAPTRATSPT